MHVSSVCIYTRVCVCPLYMIFNMLLHRRATEVQNQTVLVHNSSRRLCVCHCRKSTCARLSRPDPANSASRRHEPTRGHRYADLSMKWWYQWVLAVVLSNNWLQIVASTANSAYAAKETLDVIVEHKTLRPQDERVIRVFLDHQVKCNLVISSIVKTHVPERRRFSKKYKLLTSTKRMRVAIAKNFFFFGPSTYFHKAPETWGMKRWYQSVSLIRTDTATGAELCIIVVMLVTLNQKSSPWPAHTPGNRRGSPTNIFSSIMHSLRVCANELPITCCHKFSNGLYTWSAICFCKNGLFQLFLDMFLICVTTVGAMFWQVFVFLPMVVRWTSHSRGALGAGRCCDTRTFSVWHMLMTFSLNFVEQDCKMNPGGMQEILSRDVPTMLRRLGGGLWSACCPSLIILAYVPAQCSCTPLSAPLPMTTWHFWKSPSKLRHKSTLYIEHSCCLLFLHSFAIISLFVFDMLHTRWCHLLTSSFFYLVFPLFSFSVKHAGHVFGELVTICCAIVWQSFPCVTLCRTMIEILFFAGSPEQTNFSQVFFNCWTHHKPRAATPKRHRTGTKQYQPHTFWKQIPKKKNSQTANEKHNTHTQTKNIQNYKIPRKKKNEKKKTCFNPPTMKNSVK